MTEKEFILTLTLMGYKQQATKYFSQTEVSYDNSIYNIYIKNESNIHVSKRHITDRWYTSYKAVLEEISNEV